MKRNLKRSALVFFLLSISLSTGAQSLDKPKQAGQQNASQQKAKVEYKDRVEYKYKVECSGKESHDGPYWFSRGYELHQSGQYLQAIDAFAHSTEVGYRQATAIYNIACGFALLNDKESALTWLDRALALGFNRTDLLKTDSDLDPLRSDPRFKRFLDSAAGRGKGKENHEK